MLTRNQPIPTIDDYGLIGDCRSAALVSKYGSIDWLCWPQFDSPSIFAAIIDPDRGGHWLLAPASQFEAQHSYLPNTNVVETRFTCSGGRASLTDLMPVCSEEFKRKVLIPDHQLIREVRCSGGEVHMRCNFRPRSHYGLSRVRIRSVGNLGIQIEVDRGAYWLRSSVPLTNMGDFATASFTLKESESAQFVLTYAEQSPDTLPALGETIPAAIERSIQWWRQWAQRCRYKGPYADAVIRSALALKLLTYAPSGAVIAAPTTSLPERIGDSLNWDYRYCWLRDASLTIRAMLGLGYFDEAEAFLTWLLHATRLTQPELRVLYSVFGRIAPHEKELNPLRGYLDSRPVRVGNGAREQLQLDIYGEVIEATAQFALHRTKFDRTTQRALIGLGDYVARNWDSPDEGIWEPRFGRENHTHSRLMCWTALDRLLALSDKGILSGVPRERFTRERDRIRQQIESRAWNEQLQSYASVLDGDQMDATLLRLSWYGFEHADSRRMSGTYERVIEKLGIGNGLLYRYERNPPEGAFGLCGYWAVEHLAVGGGTLEQAHSAFQQLGKYQTNLGLLAEETDPASGNALGNFPQAFTHVGLISAALTLAEQERGKEHPAIQVGSDVKATQPEART